MKRTALALVLAGVGCGGGGGGDPDAGPCTDCTPNPDAGAFTWRLTPRDPTTIYRFEDQSPVVAGRSTRFAVEHGGLACDLWAMPLVEIAASTRTVMITPRVFARVPDCTLAASQIRVVTLELAAGTWTIRGAGTTPPPPVTLTVGAAPARACGLSPCTLDCDCDTASGERCLGAMGLGGAFTACVRPCEHNRDCGDGACVDLADGHFRTCDLQPECSAGFPCPGGYACTAGVCEPTFTLSQSTRAGCVSDQDCSGGLRCVESTTAAGPSRCEVACRTGGGWCQGAHVCGPAAADLSGLARTDSVCGFLGE